VQLVVAVFPVQVTAAASVLVVALAYRRAVFIGLGFLAFIHPLLVPGKQPLGKVSPDLRVRG
jgi:hypothetical protein